MPRHIGLVSILSLVVWLKKLNVSFPYRALRKQMSDQCNYIQMLRYIVGWHGAVVTLTLLGSVKARKGFWADVVQNTHLDQSADHDILPEEVKTFVLTAGYLDGSAFISAMLRSTTRSRNIFPGQL